MSRVLIKGMEHETSITGPDYMNLDVAVNLTGLPRRFSYDDVVETLNRAFDPASFGKSNTFTKVIYNGPATIILWDDGTKTVVKCKEGDSYSPDAGFALAVLKRLTGDRFHKCLKEAMKEVKTNERKGRETGERKA